jgi:hypothetical protein
MRDSAINRATDVDAKAVVTARDKVVADIPLAAPERILEFLSEDSLKANSTLPFPGPPQVGNLISISVLANVTAATPQLDAVEKKWSRRFSRPSGAQMAIAVLSIIAVAEFALLASRSARQQPASAAPAAGIVAVESTPPGAMIAINGEKRGVSESDGESSTQSPSKLAPENALSASSETASAKRKAPISPSAALPPAGAVGGWLSVSGAPVDLQLFESGVLIGSTQTDRIMLPVGRHVIEAVNTAVGYKTSSAVQVSAGAVTRLKLEIANGTLNINAIPWAEVTIDGTRLGPTPLGNVSLPVGSHEVVFTHPQLGERRQNLVVTLNGLNRVSVNLNQR